MKRFARLIPIALVLTVACGRTDSGITTDIKTKMAADDTVKAYQVDVDTRDRVVTLTGTVQTNAARQQAVLIARQANGVRDVVDNLVVSEAAATSGRAADITNDAETRTKEGADSVADAAKDTGKGVKEGAQAVGKGAKKGAEAVGDAAKKVGTDIKDAVTDKDHDTDKDGK